jgi:DUF1680 family protein
MNSKGGNAKVIIRDFKLSEVELNDGYLINAFRLEQDYLMSLEADRLLAGFYEIAGKQPKAKRYTGGWEDQDIAGHTMGHYLVALAQAYAATGNKKIMERLGYVVDSLAECQAESGYLSAFREELFDNLEQGKQAYAVIKATEVMVGLGEHLAISARNQFSGHIVSVEKVRSIPLSVLKHWEEIQSLQLFPIWQWRILVWNLERLHLRS